MGVEQRALTVSTEQAGTRLDLYLATSLPDLSRVRAQALIQSGSVQVDGKVVKSSHKVRAGESVRVVIARKEPPSFMPERIPLDIIFEDEHIIIVNKPSGMVVHPAPGVKSGTLVNALLAHTHALAETDAVERPGIVHRLDKNTSGLLIVAKTEQAHRSLTASISQRAVKREYRALVYGNFTESAGTIDAPIGRSASDRKKMAVIGVRSREAKTYFTVRESFPNITHLGVRLSTGRTHQIRVHMAYIGHCVVGDATYGVRLKRFHEQMALPVVEAIRNLKSHMLHAETLEFAHPISGERLTFSAPLPEEFSDFLQILSECLRRRNHPEG